MDIHKGRGSNGNGGPKRHPYPYARARVMNKQRQKPSKKYEPINYRGHPDDLKHRRKVFCGQEDTTLTQPIYSHSLRTKRPTPDRLVR
jgi:hypothetical protein